MSDQSPIHVVRVGNRVITATTDPNKAIYAVDREADAGSTGIVVETFQNAKHVRTHENAEDWLFPEDL